MLNRNDAQCEILRIQQLDASFVSFEIVVEQETQLPEYTVKSNLRFYQ